MLTAERLREVLQYDPATGLFTWRLATSRRIRVGGVAGSRHKLDGRIYIRVDGRLFKAHRLAWLYVKGEWPPVGIDHRDGIPDHNWFTNLRPATQAQNAQNIRRAHRDSSTGLLGVQRRGSKYFARLMRGAQRFDGVLRSTPQEAHADYLEFKAAHHPFATIGAHA